MKASTVALIVGVVLMAIVGVIRVTSLDDMFLFDALAFLCTIVGIPTLIVGAVIHLIGYARRK